MTEELRSRLLEWADTYNDPVWFKEDPLAFPRDFAGRMKEGKACLQDVEVAAVFAAHFAWGRRSMIVRDCGRLFDEMQWRPFDYVMGGEWRDENVSVHRTVKWSDVAAICRRLKDFYSEEKSLEILGTDGIRTRIFGQKEDPKAPNKKINMMRRWMVRRDGKVDLGLWTGTDPSALLIPLDVHVWEMAFRLGLTARRQKDIVTVREITAAMEEVFPGDPCKGDFALFGYGVTHA